MATDAAPSRRLSWRPSSVGIGSSLTLSGVSSKPSPYIEKDWNLAISSKPFFLPRVGTGDHRAPSTSRFGEHWKAPQTDAKLVLTCCPMLEPDATDANQQIDQDSLTLTNPELRRWAEKCESYRSEGVLVAPKEQMEDPDKEVLLQLDNVKKQIQRSPENLLISIKAVMAEKRRRIVTAKAAQFGKNHLNDQPQPTMNNCGSDSKMAPRPFPVMTYHEILRAAIVNNWKREMAANLLTRRVIVGPQMMTRCVEGLAKMMATPHRPVPSESPRTHKQSVFNTALGYGYNVRVTMLLKEDSLKRSPSILSLCENIARKQRQLISSSNQTFHPWSSSSSSVNALVNSCDPPSYHERDNSSRQTSSSSSTSVPLEPKSFSRSSHHPPNKPPRHKANGLTHSHDRNQGGDTLPVVYADENANTSLHTLTLNTRQSRVQGTIQSISPSHKASPSSSKTQRINSLSISGIKQDGTASNSKAEDTPTEEEDNRPCQPSVQERLSSKQPPPSLQLYANTNQQTGANSPSYALSSRKKPAKTLRSSGRYVHAKQKPDPEPKYADPISGSATSFQARLAELASLEAETVRWERLRKLKKKPRDD